MVGCLTELIRIKGSPTNQGSVLICTQVTCCPLYDLAGSLGWLGCCSGFGWTLLPNLRYLHRKASNTISLKVFGRFASL